MNYIVLDMEWNQPVAKRYMVKTPVRLAGEIIQIGAVKLDENLETVDTFEVMVAPVYYTKMNRYVHEVTLLTEEDLTKGIDFKTAVTLFKEWCEKENEEYMFFTWGADDIYMLEDNLYLHNMSASWIPEVCDAQIMFDDQVTMEDRRFSLSYAIWKFGIKPLSAHDALNDAKNTAEVMRCLDVNDWLRDDIFEYGGCTSNQNII